MYRSSKGVRGMSAGPQLVEAKPPEHQVLSGTAPSWRTKHQAKVSPLLAQAQACH